MSSIVNLLSYLNIAFSYLPSDGHKYIILSYRTNPKHHSITPRLKAGPLIISNKARWNDSPSDVGIQ